MDISRRVGVMAKGSNPSETKKIDFSWFSSLFLQWTKPQCYMKSPDFHTVLRPSVVQLIETHAMSHDLSVTLFSSRSQKASSK